MLLVSRFRFRLRNIVRVFFFLHLFIHFFIFSSSFPPPPVSVVAFVLYAIVHLRSETIPLGSDESNLADLSTAANWWLKVIATCSASFVHDSVQVSLHCHYRGFNKNRKTCHLLYFSIQSKHIIAISGGISCSTFPS